MRSGARAMKLALLQRDHLGRWAALPGTLLQRVPQVDRDAVLLQEVGKRLIGKFLERRHPVARQLLEFGGGVVVEGDQFAHAITSLNPERRLRVPAGTRAAADGWIIDGDAPMTRISALALTGLVALSAAPAVSFCAPPRRHITARHQER